VSDLAARLERFLDQQLPEAAPVRVVGLEAQTEGFSQETFSFTAETRGPGGAPVRHPGGEDWDGRFRYRRQVVEGAHAVLEFETTMDGRYVNGVDMLTCDAEGRIVDFKVMVRPLQAVEAVREKMLAALEQFGRLRT